MLRLRQPRRDPARKQRRFRQRLRAYREKRYGRRRRQIPRAAVPSFFTLMNLLSGFIAIAQVYEGRFEHACWFIVLAGFFDLLDGMVARLSNGTSLFGVELDSLSDVVSFGVAPGFLVYVFGLREFGLLGLVVAALPAVCGAVRLARFNTTFDGEKKDYFIGLPIPVQAIVVVTLILNVNDAAWFNEYSLNNLSVLIPIIVVLAGLMVSTIRFDAVPRPSAWYIRTHPRKAAAYAVALLLVIFLQQIGLLLVLTAYLFHGIGRATYNLVRAILETPLDEGAPEHEKA
ncbi:CDP-diacylglycerol--serine O-phosphatidyltransferase [Rhodocaloribacter litoris]|uniref:CDP-diacylglycerol--serine O-phosphatidyltransferase n=1 Tax=Rhodocaloribacter litoris TaxID=2558931 RepID=UPI00141F6CBE|nr:CDP-diacylglycerol--serine O-phosphatidyltransferase [Rhodocaloribacter litoris]QXD14988.1 CDP-diacylglycerol--serine O-phosphatidyltransferase [Rhodocaloribacter litoris]GIV62228.1 MAG: CDP-diacylglycerol--serine O-phosphatidyltransferase [Rhodothermaceae bacterium]